MSKYKRKQKTQRKLWGNKECLIEGANVLVKVLSRKACMSGHTLTKGDILNHNPDGEMLWKCFGFIFSTKSKETKLI